MRRTLAALMSAALLAGCGDSAGVGEIAAEWSAEEEERGDTLIVRTVSGSVWGDTMTLVPDVEIGELDGEDPYVFGRLAGVQQDAEGRIYVADTQAREVRVFDGEGDFLHIIGRAGEGPGEYTRPDGLRIGPGGEVVVRDQQGARFLVYSPDGEHLRSWRLSGTFSTSAPFYLDAEGRVYNPDLRFDLDIGDPDRSVLVRYDLGTGEPIDTLPVPTAGTEPPTLAQRVEQGGGVSTYRTFIPFHPAGVWTLAPDGAFVVGPADAYVVDREAPDGTVLRIERAVEPVSVAPDEAARARENVEQGFRARDASWRWNGPDIPEVKPPYRWVGAGPDGSIWVLRHTRGVEVENPDWSPESGDDVPRTRWEEPPVADVFDADGRYLGPVRLPEGFVPSRPAVLAVEGPLIVSPHELGYDRVVRYRLEPASG